MGNETPPSDRFRVLSIDGGGVRGLIPALVLAELERRLEAEIGERRPIADCFHLVAGTSTGGLIALGLLAPDPEARDRPLLGAEDLVGLYREDGPRIFKRGLLRRLTSVDGWLAPKYSPDGLARSVRERLGEARLREALRDVLVTSYDMSEREPHFFKRWRAAESEERNPPIVDAALATAAAPTYFPSHGLDRRALVDGGVFASNPTVAAIAEALKRRADPADLRPHDLLVVSLGTGIREAGFEQRRVSRWGRIGWIRPRRGEVPLLGAVLDGQSDAGDHWAHMVLNHEPGDPLPAADEVGAAGPRYFRFQIKLERPFALDDASPAALDGLEAAASELIARSDEQLAEIVRRLAGHDPLPDDPA